MDIILPSYVIAALELLSSAGYEAYIVGGCVRDAFLYKKPYDWDITTSAKPDETLRVFSDFRTIETGLKHGTVTVIIDGNQLEITTMRVDGEYSDNRHPDSVDFTDDINKDLSRRDFTVNAMAYNPSKGLRDPFGGAEDLRNRIIRCVGNPEKRFSEDALRILRGIRFSAVLGFDIEEETSQVITEMRRLLDNVAAERKRVELLKLLCGREAGRVLTDYKLVMSQIIPELEPVYDFPQNTPYHIYDVWTHTVKSVENAPSDPVYRMAMLLHDTGKPQAFYADSDGTAHFKGHQQISYEISLEVLRRLRFSKAETEEISRLVLYHDTRPTGERTDTLLTAAQLGADFMKRLYPVLIADAKAQNPVLFAETRDRLEKSRKYLLEAEENGTPLSIKELAVSGKDVSGTGITGRNIGAALTALLEEVIKGTVENKKDELLFFLKNNIELFNGL